MMSKIGYTKNYTELGESYCYGQAFVILMAKKLLKCCLKFIGAVGHH